MKEINKSELINNKNFQKWYKDYQEMFREIRFIELEKLPSAIEPASKAAFLEAERELIKLKPMFIESNKEILAHILEYSNNVLSALKQTPKVVESDEEWEGIKQNVINSKSIHFLIEEIQKNDDDLLKDIESKDFISKIKKVKNLCFKQLEEMEYNGNNVFKQEIGEKLKGEMHVQVSQDKWNNIIGKSDIISGIADLVFMVPVSSRFAYKTFKAGKVVYGNKSLTIFKRTKSILSKAVISIFKIAFIILISYIIFNLPLDILRSIETKGAGGSFRINVWVVIIGLVSTGIIALQIKNSFVARKKRYLNLLTSEEDKNIAEQDDEE